MNEIYEYAKSHGYEYEEIGFNTKSSKFFQAYKRKALDDERHIYLQHRLQNCLLTSGKHIMIITITIYNKSGQIGRIEAVIPISCERDIDSVLKEEENLIAFAKKVGIV